MKAAVYKGEGKFKMEDFHFPSLPLIKFWSRSNIVLFVVLMFILFFMSS
ncbi:MAG: hypothetical protein CM1200mP3_04540 [Chloroflexota bacterium]|nr:MAG: hypothetical protein CM1200mP3_04540 [Chloroflexota bacterium]